MNSDPTKQLKEIEALLAERRTFEQWLEQLEAHRDTTPEHVYLKVRSDYQARFDVAQTRLAAETDAVRSLVEGRESAMAAHSAAMRARTDERAEAEIRAAVGEFSPKEWGKRKSALDAAIDALEGERAAMHREIETLRALLTEAIPDGAAAPVEAPALVEVPVPVEEAPAPAPAPVAEPSAPEVDDVAFLRSVLGRATPHPTPISVPSIEETEPPEFFPPNAPEAEPAPVESFRRDTPLSMPADQARESGVFPRASGSFGSPTPTTSEAQKSLTCSACGALNFPTEWYCEKCGGELAAF